jgi:sigma-B regulation protein RsbU (phosphoserine phosphatase)
MSADSPLESGQLSEAFALMAEMTRGFAESMDVEGTLERGLESIASHVGAQAGSLWLMESEGSEVACRACVGPNPITGLRLPITQGIIGKTVRENCSQRVLDVAQDPNFSKKMDEKSGFVTRSLISAPISFSDEVLGAIQLINKRSGDGRFVESDAHLLQVLASSAGLAIANARLTASLIDHERVRRELELAAEIQRNLLPAARPAPFPIFGFNIPARTVSGDFFDILPLPSGCIAFCLGDVSGKGMNAAMLMAKTASLYRCLAKSVAKPGELLAQLNDEICETATRGMFVTMAAGVYNPATGIVWLANAGHEPPLHHSRRGEFVALPAEAPPLGIVAGAEFPEQETPLGGGSLYLCSDGLTEACSDSGDLLGSEGFQELLTRFAGKPLAERIEAIVAQVSELELRDDLTILAVSDEGPVG